MASREWDPTQYARFAAERAQPFHDLLDLIATGGANAPMTRAVDRLIVSGAIDRESTADRSTPMGWVLQRLDAAEELAAADGAPLELVRADALVQVRFDRYREEPEAVEPAGEPGQLELFTEGAVEPLPPPRELVVVPGASHFFDGQLDAVQDAVSAWARERPWANGGVK